ncbi:MAG: hypothetical protein M1541_02750 [Acidobacteria bacterium]|nr:hypothetical protein [Acidobacteriota bacterium]
MPSPAEKGLRRRAACPFYGFHWPEQSDHLVETGGSECGLDLDHHGPCRMEADGLQVDFGRCPLAERYSTLLNAARKYISFKPSEFSPQEFDLERWSDYVKKRT